MPTGVELGFSTLAEFEEKLDSEEHVLLVVRDSDYSLALFSNWIVRYKGRWYVLERGRIPASSTPSLSLRGARAILIEFQGTKHWPSTS